MFSTTEILEAIALGSLSMACEPFLNIDILSHLILTEVTCFARTLIPITAQPQRQPQPQTQSQGWVREDGGRRGVHYKNLDTGERCSASEYHSRCKAGMVHNVGHHAGPPRQDDPGFARMTNVDSPNPSAPPAETVYENVQDVRPGHYVGAVAAGAAAAGSHLSYGVTGAPGGAYPHADVATGAW